MTSSVPTERLFALPSFEGLRLIRRYAEKQPSLKLGALLLLIEKLEPDGVNLDLEASGHLHRIVDSDCPLKGLAFYQSCIKAVLIHHNPVWVGSMRQGRKRFIVGLDQNDQDIFEAAGLLADPPPLGVVSWWDTVVGHARLASDIKKMEQARIAEQLSIEYEREKLNVLGIEREPAWMGLDDNFAGYDVLSYELKHEKITAQMIEVKSTVASPLRFILTRHEWNEAEKIGPSYKFHVWDMKKEPPSLSILEVEQVRPHIPSDNEKGKWKHVEIPLAV